MSYRSLRICLSMLSVAACGHQSGSAVSTTANNPSTTSSAAALLSPQITLADLPIQMNTPVAGQFTQEIDHPLTPAPSVGTFQQNYWYSTQYASGPNAPVIFAFCGEAPCGGWYVQNLADSALALGAAVVALEHRYYGTSLPFADETLPNMQYLNMHNALEDAASFERWAKVNLPLSGNWIAVGGSYSGDLAAFYRLKHPELVVGAWASSSPVNLVPSFSGYDESTAEELGPTCTLLFSQAMASAATAYTDPNACAALSIAVNGDTSECLWDEVDFLGNVSNIAQTAAQYGGQQAFCAALQQDQLNPLQGVLDYLSPPLVGDAATATAPATTPAAPAGHTPNFGFPRLSHPAIGNFAGQEWWYQVCTEFGSYQIANPDRTMAVEPSGMDAAWFDNWCEQLANSKANVAPAAATYYAPILAGQASNIFFVTGSQDPWSVLSFMDPAQVPPGDVGYNVQGGSHCQDSYNLTPTSLLGVFEVHKMFHDLAVTWLDEAQ